MVNQVQIIVKGTVQGVFFRDYTRKKAIALGLKGTVRNRRDGSVEAIVQGDEARVKELEKWCWEGSPLSHVTSVASKELSLSQDFPDFRIVY